jgi:hypothetical protein
MAKQAHPIELALVAVLVVAEALAVLIAAALALVLSLASWSPTPTPASTAPAPPVVHPLALVAESLQALPHRELMELAGTRSRMSKHRLTELALVG